MSATVEWVSLTAELHGYQVSDHGQVRGLTGRELTPARNKGYATLRLRGQNIGVHQLVALAFLGPAPAGTEVCHRNGDRLDNRASNLRYGTKSENARDRVSHGTDANASKTHCRNGHAFDEGNTYFFHDTKRGWISRACRTCNRAAVARSKAARREREKAGAR